MNPETCDICNRKITSSESKARGVGSKCAQTFAGGIQAAGSSFAQYDTLAAIQNPEIDRKLRSLKRAIGANDVYFSKKYLTEAISIAQTLETAKPIDLTTRFSSTDSYDADLRNETEKTGASGVTRAVEVECRFEMKEAA
jgi:hypothetical protein